MFYFDSIFLTFIEIQHFTSLMSCIDNIKKQFNVSWFPNKNYHFVIITAVQYTLSSVNVISLSQN